MPQGPCEMAGPAGLAPAGRPTSVAPSSVPDHPDPRCLHGRLSSRRCAATAPSISPHASSTSRVRWSISTCRTRRLPTRWRRCRCWTDVTVFHFADGRSGTGSRYRLAREEKWRSVPKRYSKRTSRSPGRAGSCPTRCATTCPRCPVTCSVSATAWRRSGPKSTGWRPRTRCVPRPRQPRRCAARSPTRPPRTGSKSRPWVRWSGEWSPR